MATPAQDKPMKTVTVFIGSARKKGLTYTAARRFLDNLESFGDVRGEIVFLSDYNVGVCRGCKICFLRGEERCPMKDDRDALIGKIMSSDGVVFATPNYSFNVSAVMKIFLDRLGFVFHRPQFFGKTYTSIVVQGIYGGGRIVKYLDFAGGALGFNAVKGSCTTGLEPMPEKDKRKMEKTLAAQSGRFHRRMLKPAYPTPSIFQLMIFRMSRTSMKMLLGEDYRDYTYYRDKGWFEAGYYYPVKLGLFKKSAGAMFDWMSARMYRRMEPAPRLDKSENGEKKA